MPEGTIVGKIPMGNEESGNKLVGNISSESEGKKTHDNYPARKNADGSYSTEVSITVTNPKLNNGKPTNIPSLWKGKEVDEDTAVELALNSGNKYQSFDTIDDAVKAAKARSEAGGAGSGKFVGKLSSSPAGKLVGKVQRFEQEEDPKTAMDQLKDNPMSFASRDLIAAADTVLGIVPFGAQVVEKTAGKIAREIAPMFGKSKESIDRETDKLVQQTQDILGEPIKKAAIGLGMDKSTLEGAKITKGMEWVGEQKETADKAISKTTGISQRDASLLTDLAMVGVGEMVGKAGGKVIEKTGLDKQFDKLTDPSQKDMAKYEEAKAKRDREFQDYQDRKFKDFEQKFQGPKVPEEYVDQATGEIIRPHTQTEMDLKGGIGTEGPQVLQVDKKGVVEPLKQSDRPTERTKDNQLTFDLNNTQREFAIKDFQFKQDHPVFKTLVDEKPADIKLAETADTIKPESTLDRFLKDKQVQKAIEERRNAYFKEAGIEPPKPYEPTYKSWAEDIKDTIGVHLSALDWNASIVKNFSDSLRKLAPKQAERQKIYDAIQRGTVDQLPDHLKVAAILWDNTMKKWGKEFLDAGVIKGMLNDYASRIVDMRGVDPTLLDRALKAFEDKQAAGLPTTSRFGKARVIDNYDMFLKTLDEHGLKLRTTDLAEVAEIYGDSMFKAKLNKELIDKLTKFQLQDGQQIFVDTKKAGTYVPPSYTRMTAGMYDGYAVHPDIAASLKFVLDAKEMGLVMRGLNTLSNVTKRINVGLSLFHATTLNVGRAFALSAKDNKWFNPVEQYKELSKAYDKAWESGRLEAWQKSNLKMGAEFDAGIGVMDHVAKATDDFLYKFGGLEGDYTQKTVKLASKPQQLLDHITWNIIHDGSKLVTADALLEKAMLDHPKVPEKFLREEIARHVNDVYGGIDWYNAARDSNKFLEKLKMNMFSPEGRRYLQIVEFAPDWTLSTLRVFARAIPENLLKPTQWNIAEGLAGIYKPLTAADHARRYQVRAMTYMLTIANGLNVALSGHSLFDNKDFFSIELGDGRAIHPFKHYSEAFHWIGDFSKTFQNKLGFVPRTFLKARDQTEEEALKTAAKSVLPFSFGSTGKGLEEALGGFIGVPVTGSAEGKIGGEGVMKNFERMKKRLQRKLGIQINNKEDEE